MLITTVPAGLAALEDGRARARTAAPRLTLRLHHDLSAVEASWRALEREGAATAFQRFDWTRLVVERLAEPARNRLLVAEWSDEGGRPIMLLPLMARRRRGITTIGVVDGGVCDNAAPLVARGFRPPAEAVRAIWADLRSLLPPADLMRIDKIPALMADAPNPLMGLDGLRVMEERCYGLPIAPPPSDLIKRSTRPTTYRDLAKFQRRLERRGAVAFRRVVDPAELDETISIMLDQRRARFAAIGRFDLMSRPDVAAFYRAAAHDGLSRGPARIFRLTVDAETVATAYLLAHGPSISLIAQTIAPEGWGNCSPGIVICAKTMTWAAEAGFTFYDFSIGHMAYKVDLGGKERPLHEYAHALSLKGSVALAADRLRRRAKTEIKRRPEAFERLRSLRQALRRL